MMCARISLALCPRVRVSPEKTRTNISLGWSLQQTMDSLRLSAAIQAHRHGSNAGKTLDLDTPNVATVTQPICRKSEHFFLSFQR